MNWEAFNITANSGRYLFKFLSEENLFRFLKTGDLWFSRPDLFGDKMECIALSDFSEKHFNLVNIKNRQQKNLISCFHISTNESLAFWDTYAKTDSHRRKYALRFDTEKLVAFIQKSTSIRSLNAKNAIYGNVKYHNLISSDARSLLKTKIKYPAFRKDSVFSYEKEFRFVIQLPEKSEALGFNLNIGQPTNLPYRILINPLLDSDDFEKSIARITETKFKDKVTLSKLTKWLKPELKESISRSRNTIKP